ncbi:MAG: site-2 protease family protein [Planctomycetia bacterium]|nr:site-2 protease family protein [Planctomycetia bacterium]
MNDLILLAALDFAFWKAVLLCTLALGLIIFVHELGHFLVAKACGVRCDKFYLGFDFFGLKLLKFKYGETEYGIGVFPLGGYVKMLGQEDNPGELKDRLEKARAARELLEKNTDAKVRPEDILTDEQIAEAERTINDPRSYQSKSVPQRLAIIVAGVAMNTIFAFVAAVAAFMLGTYKLPCILGDVSPGLPAWEAGLEPDDQILSISGNETAYFDDILKNVALGDHLDKGLPVVYRRQGLDTPQGTEVFPKTYFLQPQLGATQSVTLVLSEYNPVIPASPAYQASKKLESGDMILEINGKPVLQYREYLREVGRGQGQPLVVKYARPTPEAKKARRDALKNTTCGDAVSQQRIREEYLKGAAVEEVTLEPRRARNFGVVFEMGQVQAVRLEESGPSPASRAGIVPGDTLLDVEIEGVMQPVGDPMTLPWRMHVLAQKQDLVKMRVRKADGKETLVEMPFLKDAFASAPGNPGCGCVIPELGLAFSPTYRVASVLPGSQAEKEGIQPGDVLKEIQLTHILPPNTELTEHEEAIQKTFLPKTERIFLKEEVSFLPAIYFNQMQSYPLANSFVVAMFDRKGEKKEYRLPLTEYADTFAVDTGLNFESQREFLRGSLGQSVSMGAVETWNALTMVYTMLEKLFTGQVSAKGLGGPVLIAKIAYGAARDGLPTLLMFVCLISANLAVLNLLPIPVLDGGHVVFLLYEGITGKAPNENLVVILTYAGLLLFLGLTIFVFGLDLGFISRQ